MYDENSFKNYIFWLQVKRVFLMIVFSIIGAFIGIVVSQFLIDVLLVLNTNFKIIIIAISTILFFAISLLLTTGTGKEVQDGYWKMAVLRKLTVISKKLDYLEKLDKLDNNSTKIIQKVAKEINQEISKDIKTTKEPSEISAETQNEIHLSQPEPTKTSIPAKKSISTLKINTKKLSKKS